MSLHRVSHAIADSWENEGGSLRSTPGSGSVSVPRLSTGTSVADGYAHASQADAVARAPGPLTSASL